MSIHLVGGGRVAEHNARVYGSFVAEAVQRALEQGREVARIGIVQLHDDSVGEGQELFAKFADIVTKLGQCKPVALLVNEGDALAVDALADLDGLLVGGGLTPAYATALVPVKEEIHALVASGVPYLGFSAGTAVAARRAIVGGWKLGEMAICHEDNAEDLDELTIVDGLGLVDFSIDVHLAQWGNLSRLVTAVQAGGVDQGLGLDESTVLIVDGGTQRLRGAGQAWWVTPTDGGVTVRTERGTA